MQQVKAGSSHVPVSGGPGSDVITLDGVGANVNVAEEG